MKMTMMMIKGKNVLCSRISVISLGRGSAVARASPYWRLWWWWWGGGWRRGGCWHWGSHCHCHIRHYSLFTIVCLSDKILQEPQMLLGGHIIWPYGHSRREMILTMIEKIPREEKRSSRSRSRRRAAEERSQKFIFSEKKSLKLNFSPHSLSVSQDLECVEDHFLGQRLLCQGREQGKER